MARREINRQRNTNRRRSEFIRHFKTGFVKLGGGRGSGSFFEIAVGGLVAIMPFETALPIRGALITEWNIQSRARACEACGRPFVDKENYHTLLFDEKTDFRRSDICEACWQKQYSEGSRDRKGFISYWHGVYEAPPAPSDPIQRETAESLLRKIGRASCRERV